MHKGRLEAFSDGVLAIIITIMVLEMKAPHDSHGASLADLRPMLPVFLSYILSFVYVGIYWNNHHHLLHAVQRLSGGILWANLHLLFWLSLIPFVTAWMGENHFASTPAAIYGVVLLLAAVAFLILQRAILAVPGGNPVVAAALGRDWKGKLSCAAYAVAVLSCYWTRWIACALYVAVALVWLIPDRRMETAMQRHAGEGKV